MLAASELDVHVFHQLECKRGVKPFGIEAGIALKRCDPITARVALAALVQPPAETVTRPLWVGAEMS